MEFKEKIDEHVKLIKKYKNENFKEEQTKMYLIAPFLNLLGYNVFNPDDIVAEFVADIGDKKGEKVDYALKINGEIEILIETKSISDDLNNHDIQLKRYFNVTKAKIGILTNGIVYKFFTDLEEKNIMDNKPFLVANFLDLTDDKILELKKFTKSSYNPEQILTSAEILKYSNGIKNYLNRQLENPDDDFIKIIGKEIYDRRLTQNKIEEFKVIFRDTFKNFINDFIRKKFETALESSKQVSNESEEKIEEIIEEKQDNLIITTQEELEAYYIIKSILGRYTDMENLTFKDTRSYFGVLYQNNTRKWICRLEIGEKIMLKFPTEERYEGGGMVEEKIYIDSLRDLYNFEEKLVGILKKYLPEEK